MDATALLDGYARHATAVTGLTGATVRNHSIYLAAYLRWWRQARPGRHPAEATRGDIADFLVAEAARGLCARTRRSELAALRRFYDWMVLHGRCPTVPTAGVVAPLVRPPQVETYTAAQTAAILAHTASLTDVRGRQRHAIVATLRWSGMRSGELRSLRRCDLHLTDGRAQVVGKGGRQRSVLLPPPLIAVLERFLADVRPLLPASPLLLANAHPFVTTAQHGFGSEALAREVELAGLGAGVPGRHHPHKWRHTYATELVRAGVDIHVVQRLLGHTHIASTVGYTHLVLDDLRAAVADVWT